MTPALIIRPIEADDLPQLINLYQFLSSDAEMLKHTVAEQRLAEISTIPNSHIFGGWFGEFLFTSCTQFILPNLTHQGRSYALIENVVTHTDHRRRGFGKEILQRAATFAINRGCYKVMLMTGMSDAGTLGFYASAGFEQTKTGFQIRNIPPRQTPVVT